MKLVEDNQADTIQRRIVLQPACKNTFSHDFDAGLGADPAFETDSIAESLVHLLPGFICHPFCCGTSCQSTRFEHDDCLARQP